MQIPVIDGVVIRLARSGPQIQIRLGTAKLEETNDTVSQARSATALPQ
ncbi:MAG: hypothetical protein ACHBN1_18175 [Heteroscytonema crispum UTEX LB 1556]